jgi:tetratricopeptide (TPR) repeat protein
MNPQQQQQTHFQELQREFQSAIQFHQAGRMADAEAGYRRILQRVPGHPDALHLLGVLAGQVGRPDVAIDLIRQAIANNPTTADYHCNLGEIYRRAGRIDDAIASQRRAIQLRPNYVNAFSNLGTALRDAKKPTEAIAAFRRAIELGGHFPEMFANLGNALRDCGFLDGAIAAYEQAISLNANYGEAHNNLAVALRDKKRLQEAEASMRRAIELEPNNAESRYNLGGILLEMGKIDAARHALESAIGLNPNHANAHNNLGSCWMRSQEPAKALPIFDRAVQINPSLADARFNRGLAYLMLGDFRRGLPDYEWRAHVKPQFMFMRQGASRPRWDGGALNGRTIFVHAEQGFGDTIQFSRFVPAVAQRGGKVILGAQPHVERLLRQIPGVERMVTTIIPDLKYDVHCPLLSLPLVLGVELAAISPSPYLKPDKEIVERWISRMSEIEGKKVGLVWAGSAANENDAVRTIALKQFAPLGKSEHVRFFSLQKGDASKEAPPEGLELIDWTEELTDFSETAGLIANLDLVITVDSAVAHLAGAMGKPVWILIPTSPDWRWMTGRDDSPWYGSARLFRQKTRGDWLEEIERMGAELYSPNASRDSSAGE